MAAITFKFGDQSEISAEESAVGLISREQLVRVALRRKQGLASYDEELPEGMVMDLARQAIEQSHAGLEHMVWLRDVVARGLQGNTVTVHYEGNDVLLYLAHSLPPQPSWNPPASKGVMKFSLLSWTSKMGTPSFSLPAGTTAMGGSCPGAAAGQTTTTKSAAEALAPLVSKKIGGWPVRLVQAICQHCYAEGGQYATGLVQFAQMVRYAWTRAAVEDGSFIEVMDWAVKHANYHLDGKGKERKEELDLTTGEIKREAFTPTRERDGEKYFRIHDSGDFYGVRYLAAWQEIARRNTDVTFWAPSRTWMLPNFNTQARSTPVNLILRPSAYHINEPAPRTAPEGTPANDAYLGPGWAAGTTAYKDVLKPKGPMVGGARHAPGGIGPTKPYDWDCQAYNTESDNVTCREAKAPDGKDGCRVCWKHPELEVNYTLH
jgi:hypothetical protein